MYNPAVVTADAFGDYLADTYLDCFAGRAPEHAAYPKGAARLMLKWLGNYDSLYHNAERTMTVTLVGQQVLRGRRLSEALQPEDWSHHMLSLLVHDIGYTRFPVAEDTAYANTGTEPGLARAADLIAQMADPFYHRKINALFHEFTETGIAEKLGYQTPMNLMERYPEFFWSQIQPALAHSEQTMEGKQWIAQLYNHIFQVEHRAFILGSFSG